MARKKRSKKSELVAPRYKKEEPEEPIYSGIDHFTKLSNEALIAIAKYAHMETIRQVEYPTPMVIGPSCMGPILALAAVSQKLRTLMLGETSFWSYIRIDADRTEEEAVMACLERSKNHPLTIIWIGEGDNSAPESPLLELVIEHSHRWTSFSILAPTTTYLSLLFMESPFAQVQAPNLQEFYVSSRDVDEEYVEDVTLDFPSIRHVRICGYPFWTIGRAMETLTRLEVKPPHGGQFTFEELSSIADVLVQLDHLSLHNAIDFSGSARESSWNKEECERFITWPSLLVLVLEIDRTSGEEAVIWQYLKVFRAPKLHKFVAIRPECEDFEASDSDTSRIASNMPLVQDVSFLKPDIDRDTAQPLSMFFPQTTHLSLSYYEGFGSFFYPDGLAHTKFLPKLECVTLGEIGEKMLLRSIVWGLQSREESGHGVARIFVPDNQPHMTTELGILSARLCVADPPTFDDYHLR